VTVVGSREYSIPQEPPWTPGETLAPVVKAEAGSRKPETHSAQEHSQIPDLALEDSYRSNPVAQCSAGAESPKKRPQLFVVVLVDAWVIGQEEESGLEYLETPDPMAFVPGVALVTLVPEEAAEELAQKVGHWESASAGFVEGQDVLVEVVPELVGDRIGLEADSLEGLQGETVLGDVVQEDFDPEAIVAYLESDPAADRWDHSETGPSCRVPRSLISNRQQSHASYDDPDH
jgi:hypothetical protein